MAEVDTAVAPAIVLPPRGGLVAGFPSYVQCAKYVIAAGSDASTVDYDAIISTSDGAAATIEAFSLPTGAIIHDVGWRVAVSFNAEVDLTIGDSDDVDGYAIVANVNATAGDSNDLWTARKIITNADYSGDSDCLADTTAVAAYAFLLPRLQWNSSAPGDFMSVDVTLSDTEATTGVLEVYLWYDLSALQTTFAST